ncbi:MAG: hypothetical protein WD069_17935 [Planctomycetales bacterium]
MSFDLVKRARDMWLALVIVGACMGADVPRSPNGAPRPDTVVIEDFIANLQEEPFSVEVRDDGMALHHAGRCDVFYLPKLLVRVRNHGSSAVCVDRWEDYDERPSKLEAWTAPDDEWRELRFMHSGRNERVVIDPGATFEFQLLVFGDRFLVGGWLYTSESLGRSRLRLVLDYFDDPECTPSRRKRATLPVRFLPPPDTAHQHADR